MGSPAGVTGGGWGGCGAGALGPGARRQEADPERNPWPRRPPPGCSHLPTGAAGLLPISCAGSAAASTAHRAPGSAPGHLSDARGHENSERGWGPPARRRAGGPALLGLWQSALAVPGQTPEMPIGFRPRSTGVSALGTARPEGAERAEGRALDGVAQRGNSARHSVTNSPGGPEQPVTQSGLRCPVPLLSAAGGGDGPRLAPLPGPCRASRPGTLLGNTFAFHFPEPHGSKARVSLVYTGGTEVKFHAGRRARGDLEDNAALCWCLGDWHGRVALRGLSGGAPSSSQVRVGLVPVCGGVLRQVVLGKAKDGRSE